MTARGDMTTHRSRERTTMGLAAALCLVAVGIDATWDTMHSAPDEAT